jgi:1-deoxy-D-xylulose-5-phosphate reductoisomerase
MQAVTILGATGSIGASALDVIELHPTRFRIHALTAQSKPEALADLAARVRPRFAVIGDAAREAELRAALRVRGLSTIALAGRDALAEVASAPETDTVLAAIVGAAGLVPTLAAARAGKRLLLANKESVVCAGALLMKAIRDGGGEIVPVDSEHSAIHQCLGGVAERQRAQARLLLTASGGPFRTRRDLETVTPDEACAHPNWVMGRKISVDSATLMNKGLEVIEASWLFGLPADRIDVVIHPQSVIHSMVAFPDGSVLAQMGTPDMRTPIAYALAWPDRIASGVRALDFSRLGDLSFETPDRARFPCLEYAYEALRAGGGASAVLNAANEVAVDAFLAGRLRFTDIAPTIEGVLESCVEPAPSSIDDVLEIDRRARASASNAIAVRA